MYKITTNPIAIRFMIWTAAALLLVAFYVIWSGGFGQLLEDINSLFIIRMKSI